MLKCFFLYILSQLPIVNCTCKKKWGAGDRFFDFDLFSVFFISLGYYRVYIFSIVKRNDEPMSFRFITFLSFYQVLLPYSKEAINNIVIRNQTKIDSLDISILEYKLSQEQSRFSHIMARLPTYIGIAIFIIPLLWVFFKFENEEIISQILFGITCYFMLGLMIFLYNSYSVKAKWRSDLDELIRSKRQSLYFDWQAMKKENDFFAGVVKNIEEHLKLVVIFSVLALISHKNVTVQEKKISVVQKIYEKEDNPFYFIPVEDIWFLKY